MIKGLSIKRVIALMLLGVALSTSVAKAQIGDIKAFLEVLNEGEENMTALTQAYLKPLPTGLSTAMNTGWATKAAPTKKLGFSLQVRAALATVPSSAQTFDANTLGLSSGITVSGSETNTISGAKGSGQTLTLPDGTSIDLPGGTGVSVVPAAMLQGNVGLIKDTDLTVRYIPETELGNYGDISLFGVGVKHGINQWLPGGKLLPVDLSIMAAFSKIDLNGVISEADDQVVETSTNTFVLNALVGKTLPFVSAYAGVGIQTGSFELNMLGDYSVQAGGQTQTFSDPVSYTQDSDAAIQALAGVQFKIAIFRIYAEVTAAEYTTYNAGIGFGLRN